MAASQKSGWERAGHAVLYELCAMLLLVPLASLLMDTGVGHMGVLALMMSTVAMGWNMLFNVLFERVEHALGWQRGVAVRSLHALLFEGGLVVMLVPLAAWWLQVSYLQALLLDLGFFAFFLPYTYVFNYGYDRLRARYWARREPALTAE